jgi:hydroxymethylglutaryl-CoA lyase
MSTPQNPAPAQPSAHPAVDVLISEVGPRDGLQSVAAVMPTEHKKRWISALYAAGLREIEVTSFVPARLMPQLADAADIVAHALTLPGLTVAALVPNLKGAQTALAAGAHKITVPCSASEAHSRANVRKTQQQMVDEVRGIVALRNDVAPQAKVEAGISVAFGCTLQGAVPEGHVLRLMEQVLEAGADESGMADTTGMANPAQVRRLYRQAIAAFGLHKVGSAHMHNTRGLGIANNLAAFEEGIRTFDTSLAGLGGCPHAPGASGNVVSEDLTFMFEAMGLRTGIDLEILTASRAHLQAGLPSEPLYGMLAEAGLPLGFAYADGRRPLKTANMKAADHA